jgi:predicted nucleic acid-binding Zn ribbon protein
MIETKNEHCELCGKPSNGAVFCSEACARCMFCEHRSGTACWYRVNMGSRAGHAWVGRIKHCPKVADRR